MTQKSPFLSRVLSRLFFEILPAGIVSTVVGLLFNQMARPPAPTPVAAVTTPIANDKVIELLRDEQTLLANYLSKQDDTRPEPVAAAAQAPKPPVREAATESKASVTPHVAPKFKHLAARRLPHAPAAEEAPRQQPLAVTAQAQPAPSAAGQPLSIAAPTANVRAAHGDDNVVMAKLRGAADTVGQIPGWVRSAGEWFSDDDTPPRPPADLPTQNFMRAAM